MISFLHSKNTLTGRRPVRFPLALAGCLLLMLVWTSSSSTGQPVQDPPTAGTNSSESSSGVRLGKPVTSQWEFGLVVKANNNSSGIAANFPIPRDWPEQEIEVVQENKSARVISFKRTRPSEWTEQVAFKIGNLGAGQQELVSLQVRIKKKPILAPTKTDQYTVPDKIRGALRNFLKPSPYIESRHKRIREIANDLTDSSLTAWDQVEKNYRWVRENVNYKFDTVIRTCLDALDSQQGDCEELSSLFIAVCRAQGIPARAVWIPGHTYPEFYLLDAQGQGHWFPCQAAGSYAFGSMVESRPILQKGDRFKNPNRSVAGEPKEIRYVAPTLRANGGSNLGIQFVRREIKNQSNPASKN